MEAPAPFSFAPPPTAAAAADAATDELVGLFQASLVGEKPNDHRQDFKKRGGTSQEERRRSYLKQQKASRRDLTKYARRLALNAVKEGGEAKEGAAGAEEPEELDICTTSEVAFGGGRRNNNAKRKNRRKREKGLRAHYSDNLSVPERLEHVPSDLLAGDTWYILPIPKGERCLVISARGSTVARRMDGVLLFRFHSSLPGGNKRNCRRVSVHLPHVHFLQNREGVSRPFSVSEFCILDCVWHKESRTYFVLDMMCWKGHYYYNCDVAFRFYWRQVKLDEEGCGEVSDRNSVPFVSVPWFNSEPASIAQVSRLSSPFEPGALWFYHGEAHYVIGTNPCILSITTEHIPALLGAIEAHQTCGGAEIGDSAGADGEGMSMVENPFGKGL